MIRKIDHSMIFVFIAGSYTPICAAVLSGSFGQKLLYGIWAIALLGIILKVFRITCPKWFSSVIYIAMGWLCIVALPQIRQNLPQDGFGWRLAASACHFVLMYHYLPLSSGS